MKNYARLDAAGRVIEIIPAVVEVDGVEIPIEERFPPSLLALLVPHDGGEVPDAGVSEPSEVPASVTMGQLRLALLAAGLYRDAQARIADSGDDELAIRWEFDTAVPRDGELAAGLTRLLSLTEGQVNAIFSDASLR